MHIEIQVALNFVISYLYNKLPRRRVNIFGEELEKALKEKFQGHWYPEKPFKGSAYRCLKTGDPIDSVFERAARESGVPVADILENLPNELSVWVDPGEVSCRVGEKGTVKILFSEARDDYDENNSADREVTKTFNSETQRFRPIDAVSSGLNTMCLSPKLLQDNGASPHSASSISPSYKSSPNPTVSSTSGGSNTFKQRAQTSLTFTTAAFAQTKFGSTKLKTSSKRPSSSYRMSPTEFSNYIKQRALQQQLNHTHNVSAQQATHFGSIGSVSPARSISPNSLSLNQVAESFFFPNINVANHALYTQMNGQRNLYDSHFHPEPSSAYTSNKFADAKLNTYLDPCGFKNANSENDNNKSATFEPVSNIQIQLQHLSANQSVSSIAQNQQRQTIAIQNQVTSGDGIFSFHSNIDISTGVTVSISKSNAIESNTATNLDSSPTATNNQNLSSSPTTNKLIDGMNTFYSNAAAAAGSSFQQLLVAN